MSYDIVEAIVVPCSIRVFPLCVFVGCNVNASVISRYLCVYNISLLSTAPCPLRWKGGGELFDFIAHLLHSQLTLSHCPLHCIDSFRVRLARTHPMLINAVNGGAARHIRRFRWPDFHFGRETFAAHFVCHAVNI